MNKKVDVLLVDDEHDIRVALAEFLEDEGFSVALAENGRDALDYLQKHPAPGLILLDYMMPVLSGEGFCKIFNLDPKLNRIPLALLTAALISTDQLAKLQVKQVFQKPIQIDNFIEFIGKTCRKS